MTVKELIAHYESFGSKEGRNCSLISDAKTFIDLCNLEKGLALEIGPLDNPLLDVDHPNSKFIDVGTKEELIAHWKENPNVELDKIVNVDYVWKGGKYSEFISERFKYIIASHVIEHTPDLVGFFENISSVLVDKGYLFLIIPDKRYCFDHFKPLSSIVEIVYAHLNSHDKPTFYSILQHLNLQAHNDPIRHWNNDHGEPIQQNSLIDYSRQPIHISEEIKQWEDKYTDVHMWQFVPDSFRSICNYLYENDFIDLKLIRVYPTHKNHHQFYVIMQKVAR